MDSELGGIDKYYAGWVIINCNYKTDFLFGDKLAIMGQACIFQLMHLTFGMYLPNAQWA